MKQKFTLLFIAFFSLAAFAVTQVSRRVIAEDITISPASGDISSALSAATEGKTVGNITINLTDGVTYTLTKAIKVPANLTINGNGAEIDASSDINFIELQGTTEKVLKSDGTTESDHHLINSVTIDGLKVSGLTKAIVRDTQKTLLKSLTISNSVIEASNGKPAIDFDQKGYIEQLTVNNSTIWSAETTGKSFTKYGSRPKNLWINDVPGAYTLQGYDIQNSTFVNIGSNKTLCDISQKGTAQNSYTIKNNVFVNCGKSGQVVVGFNGGQTSATPTWDVDGNIFNYDNEDTSANEVKKAGKKNNADIVNNSIEGVVSFESLEEGKLNIELALYKQVAATTFGDPRWTCSSTLVPSDITAAPASGSINDALTAATEGRIAKNITINLTEGATYTVNAPIVGAYNVTINGHGAEIDASGLTSEFISLNGSTQKVLLGQDNENNDVYDATHFNVESVTVKDVTIKGMGGSLIKDQQKTLLGTLTIDNSVIEMPASNKQMIDFNSKGYIGKVVVSKSTIYSKGTNNGYFAQYGSRPNNFPEAYRSNFKQLFDIQNSTFVNIAKGQNFCNFPQKGTAANGYTVKNNIFVDCGKNGQVIQGINANQKRTTPAWDVDGNLFNWGGEDVSETEASGDAASYVQNSIKGIVAFKDAANADFTVAYLAGLAANNAGDPDWLTDVNALADAVMNDYEQALANAKAQLENYDEGSEYYLTNAVTQAEAIAADIDFYTEDNVQKGQNALDILQNALANFNAELYDARQTLQNEINTASGLWNEYEKYQANYEGWLGNEINWANYMINQSWSANRYSSSQMYSEAYNLQQAENDFIEYLKTLGIDPNKNINVTGIEGIKADNLEGAVIYDLNGKRVEKPGKGLYIVNGKKVVIK